MTAPVSLVDIINRTVGIDTVVSSLGITLPDIALGVLNTLDKNDPEQLAGMLPGMTSLLGIQSGTVYLDVATLLDKPFNLRDFLPNSGTEPGSTNKTFLRSFECIKGGTTMTPVDSGNQVNVFVQDSNVVGLNAAVTVTSYASADMTGDTFDTETLALPAIDGFTGIYTGSFILTGGDTATSGDGQLALPAGGSVRGVYTSLSAASDVEIIGGNLADGLTAWDYGAACPDDAFAWDAARFGETEFMPAVIVLEPDVSVTVEPIAADGESTRFGLMAFKSPSFDGLLCLKADDVILPADQTTFAGLFAGIMKALEAF